MIKREGDNLNYITKIDKWGWLIMNKQKKYMLIGGAIGAIYAILGPSVIFAIGPGEGSGNILTNMLVLIIMVLVIPSALTYFTLDNFIRCSEVVDEYGYHSYPCSGSMIIPTILHLILWFILGCLGGYLVSKIIKGHSK